MEGAMPDRSSRMVGCAAALMLLVATAPALGDPVEDFYRGRTVTLVIASAEGGGYDINGRLAAAYLSKHIRGNPTVIARNMPGASGMVAADYMFNVAPQDGTVLSIPQPTILLHKVLEPAARFAPQGYTWIGRIGTLQTFGVVSRKAPAQTVAQAKTTEIAMGAAQGTGMGSNVILALNALVGTKFQLVKGYKSVSESGLAMERGEVQGISSTSWEYLEGRGWISRHEIGFLYVVGLSRNPRTPDTPTLTELAGNDSDRDVLRAIASASDVGRAILAPPNMPAERAAALRQAFTALMQDPDFLREAARRNVEIEPLAGAALQRLVAETMDVTPDVAERTRRVIRQ
jgi:tripartite-type tricarboxylate transporter receptor subunit TctC